MDNIQFADCYLDLNSLSVYSSLSISTLRSYISQGLPSFQTRGKILVKRSEFDRWMEKFKVKDIDVGALADEAIKGLKRVESKS